MFNLIKKLIAKFRDKPIQEVKKSNPIVSPIVSPAKKRAPRKLVANENTTASPANKSKKRVYNAKKGK
jgi:hypothetical protein